MAFVLYYPKENLYSKGIVQKNYPSYFIKEEKCHDMMDAHVYLTEKLIDSILDWNKHWVYHVEGDHWYKDKTEWKRFYKLHEL